MRHVRVGTSVAAAILAALVGCSSARTLEEGADVADCARCHGFPPGTTSTGATHPTVQVDPADPAAAAACSACHSDTVDAAGGIVAGGAHQNGQIDVTVAHPIPFVDDHTPVALADIASCKSCHGNDYTGGSSGVSCTGCHDGIAASAPVWTGNCTFCHGTRTANVATGTAPAAPPETVTGTDGQTNANPKVGAHQKHLGVGATYTSGVPCASCHVVPDAAAALTHFEGGGAQAAIAFSPTAQQGVTGAAYAGGTCNVYCHGSGTLLSGGQNTTPQWTSTNLACGACHGRPPPSGPTFLAPNAHEFHIAQGATCGSCHPDYTGSTVNTAIHVNGAKDVRVGTTDVTGWDCRTCHDAIGIAPVSHPVPYANHPADALAGIGACTGCHGADYGDETIVGAGNTCNGCHANIAASAPDWKANCTFCHGTRTAGVTTATAAAAPPEAVIDASDQTRANPKVGAHQAHLTQGPYANALPCTSCHVPPDAAAALTHFSGNGSPADIAFDALSRQGVTGTARYDGTSCNVYCHGSGSIITGGANRTPAWTSTGLACNACHTLNPTTGQHPSQRSDHSTFGCNLCHGTGFTSGTSVNRAVHLDGSVFKDPSLNWQDAPQKSCDPGCHGRENW